MRSKFMLLCGVSMLLPTTAFAQDQSASESTVDKNQIIVTAQFREQTFEEVPIALSVIDGDQLDQFQVDEFDELSAYVPGLVVQEQSPNNPGFVLRGITSDDGAATIEPRVSVFQNRVSISRSRGSAVPLFDLERIEVLNGPQGTLFGRSAQAGAVNIITAKPEYDLSARVNFEYGNFDHIQANGFINLPLSDGIAAIRLAGFYEERDGFIDNTFDGVPLNSVENLAFRGSLLLEPSDGIRFDLIANYVENNPTGISFKSGVIPALGGDTNPNTFASLNTFGDFLGGADLGVDRDIFDVTLIGTFELSDSFQLTSTTSYREFNSLEVFDPDGTALDLLIFAEDAQGEQFSTDVRFVYDDDGPFSAAFGFGYFDESGTQAVPLGFDLGGLALFSTFGAVPDPASPGADVLLPGFVSQPTLGALLTGNPAVFAPSGITQVETVTNGADNQSYDIFGEVTFDATDRLEIILGLRWTYDDKLSTFNAAITQPNPLIPVLTGGAAVLGGDSNGLLLSSDQAGLDSSFDGFSWRAVVNYRFADDAYLYFNYARGRRPEVLEEDFDRDSADSNGNGSTADIVGSFVVVPAETVDSFEVGLRGQFLDRRLSFQAAAYYYDYTNFQTSVARQSPSGAPVFDLINAGSASSYGLEMLANYELSDEFSVFASYAWNRGRFGATDGDGNPQRFADNQFRLAPDHSFAIGANIQLPIADGTEFFFRPNLTYQSRVFFTNDNDLAFNVLDATGTTTLFTVPGVLQDDYALLNGQLGVTFNDGQYRVAVWGKNILDEEYIIDGGNTGGVFNIPTFIAGPPARYGVSFSASF